jgi:hypothetical protein
VRILPSVITTAAALVLVTTTSAAQATRDVTGKVTQAGTSGPLSDATVGVLGSPSASGRTSAVSTAFVSRKAT